MPRLSSKRARDIGGTGSGRSGRADAVEARAHVGLEPRVDGLAERVREAADGDDLRRLGNLPWRVLDHVAVLHLLHGKLRLAEALLHGRSAYSTAYSTAYEVFSFMGLLFVFSLA